MFDLIDLKTQNTYLLKSSSLYLRAIDRSRKKNNLDRLNYK